jgi:cytochrome P450
MQFWSAIAGRYGGIARVPLKRRHVYLICDPELIYELLITKRSKYRKNMRYKAAVETFGEGLLLSEGEQWRRQRRIAQPSFKTDHVALQAESMSKITARLVEQWSAIADSGAVRDVHEDFLRLTQCVAGHYLMGPDFDQIEEDFYAAAIAIKDNWPSPPRSVVATWVPRPRGREKRLKAAVEAIDQLIYDYLARHRALKFENCGVLEALVAGSKAQNDEYDDKSLRDQLLTLFFAGHETSAVSLSWMHYLLATHPACRSKVQSEVHAVLGRRGRPDASHLDKLEYTERVINESLRLYSPIHSISRVALEDDRIGGYSIPAGSMIYISLYATHRLPSQWPDPDRFDPDRFTPEQVASRPRFAFIPFAAGHRNCIGATMALAELKLTVAQLARHYVLDLAPGHRVVQEAGTTMYPKCGMKMAIRRHDEEVAVADAPAVNATAADSSAAGAPAAAQTS